MRGCNRVEPSISLAAPLGGRPQQSLSWGRVQTEPRPAPRGRPESRLRLCRNLDIHRWIYPQPTLVRAPHPNDCARRSCACWQGPSAGRAGGRTSSATLRPLPPIIANDEQSERRREVCVLTLADLCDEADAGCASGDRDVLERIPKRLLKAHGSP